ncbi:hypothetical protein PVAG01_05670 [Phlyctema vagabunda]|uniref:Uncharacterized protein n=1 Tax=Phlyctema vagabunda TaxID=108571 RepID=A0ABR4PL04_9HELO
MQIQALWPDEPENAEMQPLDPAREPRGREATRQLQKLRWTDTRSEPLVLASGTESEYGAKRKESSPSSDGRTESDLDEDDQGPIIGRQSYPAADAWVHLRDPRFHGVDLSTGFLVLSQLDALRQEHLHDRTHREKSLFLKSRESRAQSTTTDVSVDKLSRERRDFVEISILRYFGESKQVKLPPLDADEYIQEIVSVLIYLALQWAHGHPLTPTQDLLHMLDGHREHLIGPHNFPEFPLSPAPWKYETWTLVDMDWYILWAHAIDLIYRSRTRNLDVPMSTATSNQDNLPAGGTEYQRMVSSMDGEVLLALQWKEHLKRHGFHSHSWRFVQSTDHSDGVTFVILENSKIRARQRLSIGEAERMGWFREPKEEGRFWRYRRGDIDGARCDLKFMVTCDEAVIGISTSSGDLYFDDPTWP